MTPRSTPRPTAAELRILQALWGLGRGTVRDILERLPQKTGYTTVLKLLQIMLEKKLVRRDEATRPHVYVPARAAERTRTQILRGVIEGAFSGSAGDLVVHALQQHEISAQELEQIRELLKQREQR